MTPHPEALLRAMLQAAVERAQPSRVVGPNLPARPSGRTVVVGAGKAAAAMAQAVEAAWPGPLEGLVITRTGYGAPCERIEVVEASHPVPGEAGAAAAARILALAKSLGPDDLMLCLISGGGSSLMSLPAPGVTLADKQALTSALLASGATITEVNTVRRHLSAIKGGRLAAAAYPARSCTLLVSDVPGDDPVDIASGPTVGDPTTCADALAVLERHGVRPPEGVRARLECGELESVKPGDPRLQRSELKIIAAPHESLQAAAAVAAEAKVTPHILSDAVEGESRDVAKVMAALALNVARRGEPFPAPCVLLSGGETTVTLQGDGRGGPNVEFLLALALALKGHPAIHALAADTDGADGVEDVAGAVIGPETLARAAALHLQPRAFLERNDAHSFFARLGDQVVTGPTLTNVNDLRAIYIGATDAGS